MQDTKRRQSLVRDIIFPYLNELNDTIGYSKLFLQSFSGLVNGVFDEQRKTTTIIQITPRIEEKLKEIFKLSDPVQRKEYDRYMELIDRIKDVSIQDLSYALELPRFIDGFFIQNTDKDSISKVPIEKLLGQ